ncbi:hypothetical protein QJS04_geneDACA007316 [Acorus gramineus]|uniref:Uncharacterized protein n=1 Tax=Acorus gramineus TaxID=55184 RepID=A0AAV9BPH7_ACOGR|nr:hypothetical protein QJS04_geneDACA007316 [Acorus gramineus]
MGSAVSQTVHISFYPHECVKNKINEKYYPETPRRRRWWTSGSKLRPAHQFKEPVSAISYYQYIILALYGGVTDKKAVEESAAKLEKTPKASLITSRPHVNAWWKAISSRPAVKKVAAGMILGN